MKTLFKNTNLIHSILFLAPVFIALFPILATDYFISFDGAFHLYNSSIFNRLISGDSFTQQFYQFNSSPTPNYLALLSMSFLLFIFNTAWAYKIFHLILITFLFFSFRSWHSHFNKNSHLLFLPFIFSTLFFNGFYNFVFAFILLFLTMKFYESTQEKKLKFYIQLGLLLAITYFSHSIIFLFLGWTLFNYEISTFFIQKERIEATLKNLLFLLLSALPCILLAYFFMTSREADINYLETSELTKRLFTGYTIYTREAYFASYKTIFVCTTFLLSSILIVYKIWNKRIQTSDYLLITAFSTLILYFTLPDSVGYASVFSVRIEYFFWILLVSWVCRNIDLYKPIKVIFITLFLIFGSTQIITNLSYWRKLDQDTQELLKADEYIKNKTVVYPIFASNTWEHFHISNLLGAQKNILILENSPAKHDYFPIQYKSQFEDQLEAHPDLQVNEGGKEYRIEYVLKVGKSTFNSIKDEVIYNMAIDHGQLIYQNKIVEVWQIKKETLPQ